MILRQLQYHTDLENMRRWYHVEPKNISKEKYLKQ